MGRDRAKDARDEARAAQWARIEEVVKLPPEIRERLYEVLLEAVPHLAAEKQLFRSAATLLGAILEHRTSPRRTQ
jgi:hypothetical protein